MENRELTMASPQTSSPAVYPAKFTLSAELRRSFEDNGYLTFAGVVDKAQLAELHRKILAEFDDAKSHGKLFTGGGTVHGHLNCFPGVASRFVYETLQARGILDIVQALSSVPLRAPNVGCNMNLPGSGAQNDHADSYTTAPFLIVNIAAVDTEVTNGAMEVLGRTHRKNSKYWQILLQRPERIRLCMKQGDVVLRTSMLWHRGMPNLSRNARPMLALTWEDGGSSLDDPFAVHGGHITFLPNRYRTDWSGRLRERAFVAVPRLATAVQVVRSFL
jgi:hypothetical protein